MDYLITFLEGVISFLSPCVLPLLPVYLGYFAGASPAERVEKDAGTGAGAGDAGTDGISGETVAAEKDCTIGAAGTERITGAAGVSVQPVRAQALPGALAFVAGFTVVFCALGIFAGTLGRLLIRYQGIVNIVCGGVVVLLGLSFLDVLPQIPFPGLRRARRVTGLFSAFLFGMVYAVSLTPCAGVFLGAALMLASTSGETVRGGTLLLAYSLGLGIPFVLSALLMEQLRHAFSAVKRHYTALNRAAGGFLVLTGIAMAAGWMGRALSLLSRL